MIAKKPKLTDKHTRKIDWIIICLLLINAIVIYLLVFIFFYLPFTEEIIEIVISFEYFYYLSLLIIVVLIRIIISFYLSSFFFQKWINKNIKHFMDIQFLFGLFFYLNAIIKFLDLVVFIMYLGSKFFSYLTILNLLKIIWFIRILSSLPLYLIGIYLIFYKHYLSKNPIKRNELVRKFVLLFSTIWIGVYLIITVLSSNILFLQVNVIIGCIAIGLIVWVFIISHKGKILSEINCLFISIGFTFYLFFHIVPQILIFIILGASVYGLLITTLIVELGILISFIIILIGFKTQADYSK